jgi:hypothetical protein
VPSSLTSEQLWLGPVGWGLFGRHLVRPSHECAEGILARFHDECGVNPVENLADIAL